MNPTELSALLVVWLIALGTLVHMQWKTYRPGAAIAIAYLLAMTMNHWVGATTYLWSGSHLYEPADVLIGLRISTIGVVAFVLGVLILAPLVRPSTRSTPDRFDVHERLPETYLFAGILFFLILFTPVGNLPSLRSVGSAGQELLTVGLCLLIWRAAQAHKNQAVARWIAVAIPLPLFTMVFQGFLGYGFGPILIIVVFVGSFLRRRAIYTIAGLIFAYLALSTFVSYAADRVEIRAAVSNGRPLVERAQQILGEELHPAFLDLGDAEHRELLDSRLNQNHLVGSAASRLAVTQDFAHGETLWEAAQAFVPRSLWPDKPVAAGSGDHVSTYTGIRFSSDTSVAMGHVLEFYINFGMPCVVIGFLLLGMLLGSLDLAATRRLVAGDWQGFALIFLIGLGFIRASGSLVETVATVSASLLLCFAINKVVLARLQSRSTSKLAVTAAPDAT